MKFSRFSSPFFVPLALFGATLPAHAEEEDADIEVTATSTPASPSVDASPTASVATKDVVESSAGSEVPKDAASESGSAPAAVDASSTSGNVGSSVSSDSVPPRTAEPGPPPASSSPATQASAAPSSGLFEAPLTTNAREGRGLVAEGSNYLRPIREGFRLWGFVQGQYSNNEISEDQLTQDGEPLNADEFSLRRARLRAEHAWNFAQAVLELDATTLNGARLLVRRAEASFFYRGGNAPSDTPLVVGTLGVTDVPFGAELGESQRDRLFLERSLGSRALFGTEQDLGIKVWGAYRFVNYALAFVNGEPLNQAAFPNDPNAHKDFVGRLGVAARPLGSWLLEGGVSFYTGQGFSQGRPATKDTVTWVDSDQDGVFQTFELIPVPGQPAFPSKNFSRFAIGLDFSTSFETSLGVTKVLADLIVASNMDRTLLVSDPVLTGLDSRQFSVSLALTQQLSKLFAVGVRGAFYDPNSDLLESRAGVFHLRNQTFWSVSPVVALTLEHARLSAEYDLIVDKLGRDVSGVPTDAKNNVFTVRAQVDL